MDFASIFSGGREVMLNPAAILKFSEFGYWISNSVTEDVSYHLGETEFRPFVKWKQVQCHPSLYNRTVDTTPKSILNFLNQEVKISNFPQPIRSKAQEFISVAQDNATEDILISARVVLVNVNMSTRKSEPYMSEVKNTFSEENCDKGPKIDNEIPKMCQSVYETAQNILHTKSDVVNARQIDYNGHVNQGNFIEFSFDCLAEAIHQNKVHGLSSIFSSKIERMSLLYVRECSFGEKLHTSVWRDDYEPLSFKFHVKRNDELICQAEIGLF